MSDSWFPTKVVSRLLGTSGVLIWFGCMHLYDHNDETRPTVADELSGRVYSVNNHGHIVSLDWTEPSTLIWLSLVALVCFPSGAILDRRFRNGLTALRQRTPPK